MDSDSLTAESLSCTEFSEDSLSIAVCFREALENPPPGATPPLVAARLFADRGRGEFRKALIVCLVITHDLAAQEFGRAAALKVTQEFEREALMEAERLWAGGACLHCAMPDGPPPNKSYRRTDTEKENSMANLNTPKIRGTPTSRRTTQRNAIEPDMPPVQTPTVVPENTDDADELDLRDATLAYVFDEWRDEQVTLEELRASPRAASDRVSLAIIGAENRRDQLAMTIMATRPETDAGARMREAVIIATVLPVLQEKAPDEWDPLRNAIDALNQRAAELAHELER